MQWRCYNCALVMGNHMPPMEALSPVQCDMARLPFAGIELPHPFEDLTRANFCAWCLVFLDEFGEAAALYKNPTCYHNSDEKVNWIHANREMWMANIFNAYGHDISNHQMIVMEYLFNNLKRMV